MTGFGFDDLFEVLRLASTLEGCKVATRGRPYIWPKRSVPRNVVWRRASGPISFVEHRKIIRAADGSTIRNYVRVPVFREHPFDRSRYTGEKLREIRKTHR